MVLMSSSFWPQFRGMLQSYVERKCCIFSPELLIIMVDYGPSHISFLFISYGHILDGEYTWAHVDTKTEDFCGVDK